MSEKTHVLVIDDDVQLVDSVKTLLEAVGYKVTFAYQAEKGMELAKEAKPDLILLDIMFAGPPGPDGTEISRRLREDPILTDTPVIVLSGIKKALDMPVKLAPDDAYMPVEAFVEKPFKPNELLALIEKVLGSRE